MSEHAQDRAEQLVRNHVNCNVTGMVTELAEYGDEDTHLMLYGDIESSQVAYDAQECGSSPTGSPYSSASKTA